MGVFNEYVESLRGWTERGGRVWGVRKGTLKIFASVCLTWEKMTKESESF